jgi:hypothetical protein
MTTQAEAKTFARRMARDLELEELDAVGGGIGGRTLYRSGPYGGGAGSDTDTDREEY